MSEVIQNTTDLYDKMMDQALRYGPKVAGALLVLFGGFWLANRIADIASGAFRQKDFDLTVQVYLARIISIALKVLVVLAAAGMVGVETTSFLAVLGAAGLAVGLALQGSLANFAGGVLILILRPFEVGDQIESQGEKGTVTAIDVFYTTMTTGDNRRVILPNGPLIGGVIVNVSAEPTRRIDIAIGISYADDIGKAQRILMKMADEDARILKTPAPVVGVVNFGASSVDMTFQAWTTNNAEYTAVSHELYRKTKESLDAGGVTIPFPRTDVFMINK